MSKAPIYLDYAATTPVDPRVAERMATFLTQDGEYGNPASVQHAYGQTAHEAVEQARARVAALIGAQPAEMVWTSGATESNNLALKGAAEAYVDRGRHIVTMKTEHKSVVDTCRYLEQNGWRVTWLAPEADGRITLQALEEALADDTVLVSLMMVNNETGVLQDIRTVGELTSRRGVLLHVDAAQAAGKLPIDVEDLKVDLLSLSAHKYYGPKGIGALYVRRQPRVRLAPQIHGGGHERGMRSGTLPTHQVVGMGEASRLAISELNKESARVGRLRERLLEGLMQLPEVYLNGSEQHSAPGILNLSFGGVAGEALHATLAGLAQPIAISSGSACTAASQESSYVLRALGCDDELAYASVRFSLGRWTSEADIEQVTASVMAVVNALRRRSARWRDAVQDSDAPELAAKHIDYSPAVWRYFVQALQPVEPPVGDMLEIECATPGSRARLKLSVSLAGDRIDSAVFKAYGCVSTLAVGAWLCEWLQGQRMDDISLSPAEIEQTLELAPIKRHCALLAEDAVGMLQRKWRLNTEPEKQIAS